MSDNVVRILEQDLAGLAARRRLTLSDLRQIEATTDEVVQRALGAGMTQRRIAELLGLSFGRISQLARFERGDYRKGARR